MVERSEPHLSHLTQVWDELQVCKKKLKKNEKNWEKIMTYSVTWKWACNTAKTFDTMVMGCGVASGWEFRNHTRTCATRDHDTVGLPAPVLHPSPHCLPFLQMCLYLHLLAAVLHPLIPLNRWQISDFSLGLLPLPWFDLPPLLIPSAPTPSGVTMASVYLVKASLLVSKRFWPCPTLYLTASSYLSNFGWTEIDFAENSSSI